MRKGNKLFATLVVLIIALFSFSTVFAQTTASQDGLKATLTTDKDVYSVGDTVKVDVTIENTNSYALENVSYKAILPTGLVASKDSVLEKTFTKIEAGTKETISVTTTAVKDSSSIKTGDLNKSVSFIVMALAAAVIASVTYKKNRKAGNLFMCAVSLVVLAGLVTMLSAQTSAATKSFTLEKTVKVGNNDQKITATIYYEGQQESTTITSSATTVGNQSTEVQTTTVAATTKADETTSVTETDDQQDTTAEESTSAEEPTTVQEPTTMQESTTVQEETTVQETTVQETKQEETTEPTDTDTEYSRVSVHDPSVVKDPSTGNYYIFGSHMAWARSTDLENWTTFTNNINTNYATIFQTGGNWAKLGASNYNISGNLWAPDVIYNKSLGKWCMYMSVNGPNWNSSIALATADSIEGPYTYVGTVIYSGFNNGVNDVSLTDYQQVTGSTDISRYLSDTGAWNSRYGAHAIDPCVFYDEEGILWMSYGSWSGGIYMIKLDSSTGLRDYSRTYEYVAGDSDPYMGIKLAGGYSSSGEASYIQHIGNYYFLFISNGGLVANGGYNMRVYRSATVTGPYLDESGDSPKFTTNVSNTNGTIGNRLMTYYKWSNWKYAQVAQGHNSAFVDSDGKAYVVYHTRTNDGTEGHSVRVHQLFTNEDGWLVAAPYEYCGETLSSTGYTTDDVAGVYEILVHKTDINYSALEYVSTQELTLKADGTVEGAYTGTWKMTANSPYVTLTLDSITYKGVFVEQKVEGASYSTMTFTILGTNEINIWGSKYADDSLVIDLAMDGLTLPSGTFDDLDFTTDGLYGTTISWSSDNTDVLANDGSITPAAADTTVNVTVTVSKGESSKSKTFNVVVYADKSNATEPWLLASYFKNSPQDLSVAIQGTLQFPNPFNKNVNNGLQIYNGIIIKFNVTRTGNYEYLSNILGFTDSTASGKLYFTGGSYLGYNATGGYFDANVITGTTWSTGTDFIGTSASVEIHLLPSGYAVYVNGQLAYTQADITNGTIKGSNSISAYTSVLKWLNQNSDTLNFGWGSWWDGGLKGTISDVECYVYPIQKEDKTGYLYYQSYTKSDSISDWFSLTSGISSFFAVANDGDSHGNYFKFLADSSVSGNRGAYHYFPTEAQISGKYTIQADVKMTPGTVANRSLTDFTILGSESTISSGNINAGVTSGYILRLSAGPNSTNYYINGSSTQYVTIPSNTWVTVKVDVDTTTGTAYLTISGDSGDLFAGNITMNGTGVLKGLYTLRGRGLGTNSIDNISIKVNE